MATFTYALALAQLLRKLEAVCLPSSAMSVLLVLLDAAYQHKLPASGKLIAVVDDSILSTRTHLTRAAVAAAKQRLTSLGLLELEKATADGIFIYAIVWQASIPPAMRRPVPVEPRGIEEPQQLMRHRRAVRAE
jgi:hypothetical protein